MAKYKVVVSDTRHKDYVIEKNILEECGAELILLNCKSEADVIRDCKDADGILLDMAPINSKVVKFLDKCLVISRYGVGYDNVDVEACTKKGIYVANVPDYCAYDVSEMAIALLLTCQRQTSLRDRKIREGNWNMDFEHTYRIQGKILSVLGFGRIARELVKKVSGFGFRQILVFDPYVDGKKIESYGAKKASFEQALTKGDYISLHMPVTEETRGIIDGKAFSMMKPSSVLINTSRGQLIEEEALINALEDNSIAFAGLDTHNQEPIPADSKFLKFDNCVLTDHTGFRTRESLRELKTKVALNVKNVLKEGRPLYPVNSIEKTR